jgi:DHA1 family bicyclomycin/chloramphenicol resistance-like MFS transporter
MIAMASILCYVSYSPVWLIGHLGMSELMFSGLFGLNALVNVAACFAAPVLIKRIGNRPGVVVALSLMVLAAVVEVALQLVGPDKGIAAGIAFMAPMMLLCVGFAILLGPATSMALSAFGERAGTATAMLGCIQMSGASMLTALIQLTDIPAPYAIAIVMGGFCSVLLAMMAMNRLSHLHQEQLQHD